MLSNASLKLNTKMDNVNAYFDEASTNLDDFSTKNEFRDFMTQNSIPSIDTSGFSIRNDFNSLGASGSYGSSSFHSSAYETSATGSALQGDSTYTGTGLEGTSYGSSLYRSSVENMTDDLTNINVAGTAGLSSTDTSMTNYSSASKIMSVQQYERDAQRSLKDSNPQIVRGPSQTGLMNYTPNIRVRFLQPPADPPPRVR